MNDTVDISLRSPLASRVSATPETKTRRLIDTRTICFGTNVPGGSGVEVSSAREGGGRRQLAFDAPSSVTARAPTRAGVEILQQWEGTINSIHEGGGRRQLAFDVPLSLTARAPTRVAGVEVLQQWEGTIDSIVGDDIVATMRDLTDPHRPDEIITVDRGEFADADAELLDVGAVFYWNIGYRIQLSGTKERVSIFELRRRPAATREQIARAEHEANALVALFAGEHAF